MIRAIGMRRLLRLVTLGFVIGVLTGFGGDGRDEAKMPVFTGETTMGSLQSMEPVTGTLPMMSLVVNDMGDEEDADPSDGICATSTGVCTLRAAIQQVNAGANETESSVGLIVFDLPGVAPYRIQPATPLPPITVPILIDGTTQPGYDVSANTPIIELDGSLTGIASGLVFNAGDSAIRGLAISNFAVGVFIDNSHNNIVGTPEAGNVISGNLFDGILISGTSTMNEVRGNVIDTNMATGVVISEAGLANSIQDNSISGNLFGGILISGTSTMNEVMGNSIFSNLLNGILVSGSSTMNEILGNSIFSNSGLGIDLGNDGVTPNDMGDADTGPNNLQNAPELLSALTDAQNTTITGSLNSTPETLFVVEFFANTSCDPSGYGEGETFIGSMMTETDAMGDVDFTFSPLELQGQGVFITATATDPSGNTSEFSICVVNQ